MPRCVFNIYDGRTPHDDEGAEIASVHEIRLYMLAMATELFNDPEYQRNHWQMEVLDERGRIVSTMDFGLEQSRDQT